jgi:hypothetical protein
MANLDRATESAEALDAFISKFNADYKFAVADMERGKTSDGNPEDMKKLAERINVAIYGVYREMQDELLRLDRNLEPGFANEGLQHNITMLYDAHDALKNGNVDLAVYDYLSEIESLYAATAFDEDVYDRFAGGLDADVEGTWAEGRLVSKPCRADAVMRSLLQKTGHDPSGSLDGKSAIGDIPDATGAGVTDADDTDEDTATSAADMFADEIRALDKLISNQEDELRAVYNGQEDALAKLIDSMNELLDTYTNEDGTEEMGA